jgi:hypothetical protein
MRHACRATAKHPAGRNRRKSRNGYRDKAPTRDSEIRDMDRRTVLKALDVLPLAGLPLISGCTTSGRGVAARPVRHVRSGDPGWPGRWRLV